jgi:prephenate dehydratase
VGTQTRFGLSIKSLCCYNGRMKIAIQGQLGSFHDEAVGHIISEDVDTTPEIVSCLDFRSVFSYVEDYTADAGLVAVENNLYGSINEVYRLFATYNMWITHEVRMHIEQCLIANMTTTIEMLRSYGSKLSVLSQAPALAQVTHWLDHNLPGAVRTEAPDTAASVAYIMRSGNPYFVAIAGAAAAIQYDATIVERGINDDPGNYTRFVFFTRAADHKSPLDAQASSIIITTDHTPGALYRALGAFNNHSVNLVKLDSHPVPGDEQHYNFYIDADQPIESEAMQAVLAELSTQNCRVKQLGSYKRHL